MDNSRKGRKDWESVVLRLLRTPRTRRDLERRMAERGCPDSTARELLDEYQDLGMIDDRAYALLYIESKQGCGARRLRDELRDRGVSDEDIDDAFERSEADDLRRAVAEAETIARIPGMTERKLTARLLRRGFSYSDVRAAIEETGFCEEE